MSSSDSSRRRVCPDPFRKLAATDRSDGRAMWVDHRSWEPVVPIGELQAYPLGGGTIVEL